MIVDKDENIINELAPRFTGAMIGDCTKEGVLRSLGVNNFDICFVTISDNFQSSLEITSLLKELGAKYVVSKANRDLQAKFLLRNGADEVDMVINLAMVKDGCWDDVAADIRAVREVSRGRILKVIIECCLLTEEEKRMLCRIVSDSGADYIKTSTGFSTGGATADDVRLLRTCCPPHVKVKAAGGIASLADAEEFIRLGADRLGTSRIVKIAMAQEQQAAEAAAAPQQPEAAAQPETPEQQDTTY